MQTLREGELKMDVKRSDLSLGCDYKDAFLHLASLVGPIKAVAVHVKIVYLRYGLCSVQWVFWAEHNTQTGQRPHILTPSLRPTTISALPLGSS